MIIVEGPDGAGKTTLIRQMQARYQDLGVAPRVVSQDTNEMVDLQDWVNKNLSEGFQYQIFDRYRLISEFVYGPILRPQARPGFTSLRWTYHSLRRFYDEVSPVIIYCLPPLAVVKENLLKEYQPDHILDHIEQIYSAYVGRAALDMIHHPGRTVLWDYTEQGGLVKDDPLNFLDPVINYAKGRASL